ncbi:MAG: hypothetical protein JW809_08405 [Pirellulales bacterium]|nr:hypothetical protein [Pirellulales bacterium]
MEPSRFLMTTCQVGAEPALKAEVARRWPEFRLAFSRPGFVTFKLPEGHRLPDDFAFRCVFARAHSFSLGKATGATLAERAEAAWRVLGERPVTRVHVWARDECPPGGHVRPPTLAESVAEAAAAIRAACPCPDELNATAADVSLPAQRGQAVLDCVLVEPDAWWVGHHRARSFASRWPGGMLPLAMPEGTVSRAWLKMEEGLRWSRLPIRPGARVAEIGSAPGGASQALLARGYRVVGIDPAAMHPAVLADPNFTHIRRRAAAVRRREFRKIRWITADMNVAPTYTLDVVGHIVTNPENRVHGLLLTLKLIEWDLADEAPSYLDRIRSWGYNVVRARQLEHNRQEICVAALRRTARPSGG